MDSNINISTCNHLYYRDKEKGSLKPIEKITECTISPQELTITAKADKIGEHFYSPAIGIDTAKQKKVVPLPERYIINENATILFWADGEKTIVKRCEYDAFNPRLAFLTAFFQNYCGMSKNKANKYLANLEVEDKKKKEIKKPKHMKEEN